MPLTIDLDAYADNKFKVLVNDSEIFIKTTYNSRSERWFLSFSDTDDQPIVRSCKLLPNRRVTYSQTGLPTGGDFYCIDTFDIDNTPELGFDSLPDRLKLYWLTYDEITNYQQYLDSQL